MLQTLVRKLSSRPDASYRRDRRLFSASDQFAPRRWTFVLEAL